ncbi:MAG: RIP metalloprotease RseP [Alphaproteobacteria bacterium]
MDFSTILNSITTPIVYIAPFLIILTVIVFFHELGHFLVARWLGVAVQVFSVGFGPSLFGFTDRKGTRWQVSAIPLGGYVKFLGDENAASVTDHEAVEAMTAVDRGRTFASKPVGTRALIVVAGPVANFLLAIVIFTTVFATFGRDVVSPRVDAVVPQSAAEEAGLQPGDLVLAIDGSEIDSFSDLQRVVGTSAGQSLSLTIARGDQEITVTATPRRQEITDRFGNALNVGILGISRNNAGADVVTQHYSVPEAAVLAVSETWFVVDQSLSYLYRVIVGTETAEQLGGPIRIAQVSSQIATLGVLALVNWAALISVSIGLINLFPIPLLDGGHLVFFAAEAIRGRPLSERIQEIGFRLGFAAIGMLMIFTVWNDILR